ncbi:MAG TPA: class III cytochrome c [Desulfobulbaceae bacterium]|nr:class III cytochrome c [Desulfobulbaceae bacterium]
MKKVLIYSVALAFLCSTGLVTMATAAVDKGPAEITLNPDGKKPALFPHAKHQEKIKCGECHHGKDAAGKKVAYVEGQKNEKCVTCHTGDMLKGKVKGKTAIQRAGHGNCLACHKDMAKKDAKLKKIKKCTTCHPKKKK